MPAARPPRARQEVCQPCDVLEPDRLRSPDTRNIRVATCWKRWDESRAPCQVPRERFLFYDKLVPGASASPPEDYQSVGQARGRRETAIALSLPTPPVHPHPPPTPLPSPSVPVSYWQY